MAFQKGQSGNPKGRPPKSRALTHLLEKAGGKKRSVGGKNVAARELFAERVWEGLTTGRITFPGSSADEPAPMLILESGDFIALARLVLTQIDGPPKGEMDLTSGGRALGVQFTYVEARESDPEQSLA